MRIFVLGGNGFVGSAFARVAKKQGHSVTTITRQTYNRYSGNPCDLFINANGNSRKYLAEKDPLGEFDASTVSVLRSLLDFPCERYVFVSSIDVYPRVDDPKLNHEDSPIVTETISRYGLHKFLAEQLVRKYASRWLIIRMGGMVGEGLWKNAIFDILHRNPMWVDVDSAYQFINTCDAASIVLDLANQQQTNEVINVSGTGCVPLRDVCAMIPGFQPQYAVAKPRLERYEINLAKLQSKLSVPETRSTLETFVRQQTKP